MTATADTVLTYRQQRFIFEYLKDQNASAAAVRAGYAEKSRAAQANELMNNPAVRERIRIEMQSLLAELRCSELALIKERMRAAFFRAEKMFRTGWEPLAPGEMDEETRAALEVTTVLRKSGPVVRVRQPSRDKALRALERVHERLEKRNEQHYAKLEREGRLPTLEEIERMDQAEVQAQAGASAGVATAADCDCSQKPMVLSGSAACAAGPGVRLPAKTMVLSGCATAADRATSPAGRRGAGAHPVEREACAV